MSSCLQARIIATVYPASLLHTNQFFIFSFQKIWKVLQKGTRAYFCSFISLDQGKCWICFKLALWMARAPGVEDFSLETLKHHFFLSYIQKREKFKSFFGCLVVIIYCCLIVSVWLKIISMTIHETINLLLLAWIEDI